MATATRKCALKSCSKRNPPDTMIIKGVNAWCNDSCQSEHALLNLKKMRVNKERAAKKEKLQHVRKRREYYANDYSYQLNKTKKAAQTLANRLDAHLPCICCDRPRLPGKVFCGGHFKTGKAHSEFAVDLCNIHGQENVNCNQHLSGNINGDKNSKGFKQGLLDRYGQSLVDYLESHQPRAKLSCQELIELRAVYAAETRRIEKGLPPTRNWREPGDFDRLRAELPCNKEKAA